MVVASSSTLSPTPRWAPGPPTPIRDNMPQPVERLVNGRRIVGDQRGTSTLWSRFRLPRRGGPGDEGDRSAGAQGSERGAVRRGVRAPGGDAEAQAALASLFRS